MKGKKALELVVVCALISSLGSGCTRNFNPFKKKSSGEESHSETNPSPNGGLQNVPTATGTPSPAPEPIILQSSYKRFVQPSTSTPIDLVMSLDNASSGGDWLAQLESALPTWVADFRSTQLNLRIGVLKATSDASGAYDFHLQGNPVFADISDTNAASILTAAVHGVSASGGKKPAHPVDVLSHSVGLAANSGFYRADSVKVGLLLDSDDHSTFEPSSASDYLRAFSASSTLGWKFISLGSPSFAPCQKMAGGQALFESLVAATGGLSLKLCENVTADLVKAKLAPVIQTSLFEYSCSDGIPTGYRVMPETVSVKVGGAKVSADDANGFSWLPDANRVRLNGSARPKEGQQVEILFTSSSR